MSADEHEENGVAQDEPMYKLQMRFKKENLLELALTAKDCLFELRSYITDLPYLYFQPSFHFQYEGKKINEYNELEKEIPLETAQQPIKIDVVLDEYDYKSAKELVRRINEFFQNPKKIISQIRLESKSNFIKLDFGNLLGKTSTGGKEKKKNMDVNRVLGEGLAVYPSLAKDPWHRFSVPEKNYFIVSLEFSGWNPPPSKRRMVGDFFYLKLVTVEKETHFITAFSRGFYINKITDDSFDPSAASDPYFSLLDLIASVSPHFKKTYDNNMFESIGVDLVDIPMPRHSEPIRWLKSLDEIDDHEFDAFRAGEDLYDNFKSSTQQFRDWNEEMQNYKKVEAKDFYDHLNKAKIHERIQKDFLEAAVEGATAIVEGKLASMNVSSQQNDRCFIYNNIFYTFCADDTLKICQPRGEDAPATVVTASKDLDHASLLGELDGSEVHSVQTALIRYRGYCVTAQSLIQGILYYDEKTWTKYGSVDEGQSIADDQAFCEAVKKISKIFHAKDDLVYIDKEGKKHTMSSPIDVKGIQGGDGRKYVLDLFRLCPRDLNWEGPEFDAVIFRPKLVENYLFQLRLDVTESVRVKYSTTFTELKQQQQQVIAAAQKKEGEKISEEENKELKEKLVKIKDEFQKLQNQMHQEAEEELQKQNITDYRFDTSLYSGQESHYEDPAQAEAEREKLRKLAAFAKDKAIPSFIEEWVRMAKGAPLDSHSLVEALHTFGLSSRHLGMVLAGLDIQTSPKHYLLAKRSILVRSLKHLLEYILRSIPSMQVPDTISHVLNCAIGGKEISDYIQQKVVSMSKINPADLKATVQEEKVEPIPDKKKKIKKKQTKVQQVKCDIAPNKYMLSTPEELFSEVKKIAEARYKHTFTENKFSDLIFASNPIDRSSLLRDICLSIGLVLGYRDFNFGDKDSSSFELPIKPSDIGDFVPSIKKNDVEFPHTKINYALGAQYVTTGKYDAAIEVYNSTLQALLNVNFVLAKIYGPCHHSVLEFANTLSTMYASVGKKEQAVAIQKSVVKLTEKTYGVDDPNTVSAFTDLARFYYEMDSLDRTQSCLLSGLYLADLVGGSFNIESIRLLEEVLALLSEKKDLKGALVCAKELLARYLRVFDKSSPHLTWIYYHLATLHSANEEQKEAVGYAQQRLAIISKLCKTTQPAKVEEAKKFVNLMMSGNKAPMTPEDELAEQETMLLKERLHQNRLLNKRR